MSTSPSSPSSSSPTSTSTTSTLASAYCTTYLFIMIIVLSFTNVVIAVSSESEMLMELKGDIENTKALDLTWKDGENPCNKNAPWLGVGCRNEKVRTLRLSALNLSGEFNVEAIEQMTDIRSIDIGNNEFTGPIPDFYVLTNLRDLIINDNKFTGEIIDKFFAMNSKISKLRTIDLSGNGFTGKLPESMVSSVPHLKELQLQHNNFSGPIPFFQQQNLRKCNLAHNNFEGEIPDEMIDKFGPDSFTENPGVCSKRIGKECSPGSAVGEKGKAKSSTGYIKWIVLGVILAILVAVMVVRKVRKRRMDDLFAPLGRENNNSARMNMPKAMSVGRSSSINRRVEPSGDNSSQKSTSAKGIAELIMVNDERGTFGLPDLMKASAEVLGNGALGSAYKAAMANGVSVVVKRLKDMNKLARDEFYMEMRHLGGLRHKNILPPLAYHYRKEEKLVVSEFVPRGSLLYLMHGDRGSAHNELTWPIRLKIIKGVAQGMAFLHSEFPTLELPHGNLKSSNILLSADFEPLLNDYSFHQLFSATQSSQYLFAYKSPEAVLSGQVTPKSDAFCLGIIILEVLTGKFPSQYFNNQKGGTDVVQWAKSVVSESRETELIDPEIASPGGESMDDMLTLLQIGIDCINSDHHRRISIREATSRIADIRA